MGYISIFCYFFLLSRDPSNATCGSWDCVCAPHDETTGGMCGPGYYCPRGAVEPVPCDGGMYCEFSGQEAPTALCFPGYYCNHSSSEPDQHICPAGHYCGLGTAVPEPCPAGTFSLSSGNDQLADCINCTGGVYCQGEPYVT